MSSADEEYDASGASSGKKRRIQRACDICRRKKSDGGQMAGNRCSNCIAYAFDCTYVEAAKKRGPPKGYVESLENRLEKMEKLLHRICPDGDLMQELSQLDGEHFSRENFAPPLQSLKLSPNHDTTALALACASKLMRSKPNPRDGEDDPDQSDDDFIHLTLADSLKDLAIDPIHNRFFGKSSGVMLIQTAIDLKNQYTGNDAEDKRAILGHHRSEFWRMRPWEVTLTAVDEQPHYDFPDDDLITMLVDYYFHYVNLFIPLLHRPTFERELAEGKHLSDDLFGATLLLVCAVGSRYSNDPRVYLDGTDSASHSSGWKWFRQVQMVRKSLLAPPTLYDLQFYCLSVMFLQGSSAPQACWTMVGIGIRLAQDVGAHRRKVYGHKLTVEDELWKRAFWVLVFIDRLVSSALGRPCAIQDEDFDVDLPVECDDEYWEHPDPDKAFKQPPGKPSGIVYFNCYLKLNQVLAFALRTIYSINKSKILLGFVGQQWEQHIVAELDSALNQWVDAVPDHLRWDPNRENKLFFDQSAYLYANYYHLQILIHRPFIPSPRKPSPLSFPSLAICTNAARSCSHIIDIHRKRSTAPHPAMQMPAFTAGIVLLLNIWGGKRSGLSNDPRKEMADVHKCMQLLRTCEERWHSAGRLWDILFELACVGDLPLPKQSPTPSNKRERDSDSPMSTSTSYMSSPSSFTDVPRTTAGSQRITGKDSSAQAVTTQPAPTQIALPSVSLPMYSDELGRLPLHCQANFTGRGDVPSESDLWYEELTQTSSSGSGPLPQSTSLDISSDNMGNISGGGYPMEPLFYEQMPSNFATSYGHGEPPSYHQAPRGMHPMTHTLSHQQPPLASHRDHYPQAMLDINTIAMWSNAPTGFEMADWGTYIANVSELNQLHSGPDLTRAGD